MSVRVRALTSDGSVGKSSCTSRMGSIVVEVVWHFEQVTEDKRDPANVWSVFSMRPNAK